MGDLVAGAATLHVRAEGFAARREDLVVPDSGGRRAFTLPGIELGEEGVLEGVVVDARGDPVPGARVSEGDVPVYLAVGATPPGVAVADAHGHFRLSGLPEGLMILGGYAPDVGRGRAEGVHVLAGRTVDVGRVVLEKDKGDDKASEPASSGGVAVTLGETGEPREVVIVHVAEASEAERAGVAPGDVLLEVDGVRVTSMEEARTRLSGPLADDVVVTVRRGDARERFRLAREQVRR
jgi:membrane-associated protease RseP (regulator of RpoE activity)